jgi:4-amino-4-deoxy-L-arabinose transferase-like glycosyltransferase
MLKSRAGLTLLFPTLLFLGVLVLKLWLALQYQFVVWDSYAYLDNARVFLSGAAPNLYFELLRPPLLPWLLSVLWGVTGESITVASIVQPLFTVAAAAVLYLMGKEMFNKRVGVFSASVFLITPLVFVWTNQILTHGVMVFFASVAVYSLWKATSGRPEFYLLVGISAGLAGLARYTGVLMVLVAAIFVSVILIARVREGASVLSLEEVTWITLGVAAFLAIWSPWLEWNYINANGNPLASLIGGSSAIEAGSPQPWYYYLISFNAPGEWAYAPIGVFAAFALAVGFRSLSKKAFRDRRALLLATWLLVFFSFYSTIANKQVRFYVDWFMPLALVAGIGFDNLIRLFDRHPYLRRLVLGLAVIWLIGLSYTAIQGSYQDISGNADGFKDNGFLQAVSWAQSNMNVTDLGASDLPPYFAYYTHRNFVLLAGSADLLTIPESRGIPLGRYFSQLGVKYVIVTLGFAQSYHFGANSSALKLVTSAGVFRIYVPENH